MTNDDIPSEHDSMIDAMLDEALGSAQAPDLRDRIRRSLAGDPPAPRLLDREAPDPVPSEEPTPRHRGRLAFAAAAAGFLIGIAAVIAWQPDPGFPVSIEVVSGRAVIETNSRRIDVETGTFRQVELHLGDRIASDAGAGLQLHPLGLLSLDRNSTVEVTDMAWSKRDGVLVASSLVFGAVTGGFTWSQFADPAPVIAATPTDVTAPAGADQIAAATTDLQGRIQALENENAALRVAAEQRTEVKPSTESPAEEEPIPAVATFEAIVVDGFSDQLSGIDFDSIGKTSAEMDGIIGRLADALAGGEKPSLTDIAEIQRLNSELIGEVAKMVEAKIEGAGANGTYTHPAVSGNTIMATLAAAGLGVNDAQEKSLRMLMEDYSAKDKIIRQNAASDTFALSTLLAETDYKQKFHEEVHGMLTAEQAAALSIGSHGDRMGLTLHGPALVYAQFAKPIQVKDRDSMVDHWVRNLSQGMGAAAPQNGELATMVGAWVDDLPDGFWDNHSDALGRVGIMRTTRIREAARQQLVIMRRVMERYGATMSEADRTRFTSRQGIFVPMPR